MGAALDIAQVAVPGAAALGGAYYGARWQASREADAELRVVVDQAIDALQGVNRAVGRARSHFLQEAANTTPEGYVALGELEERMADAEGVRARLIVRTEKGSPLPVHFMNALLAVGRANDELRTAGVWAASESHHFDVKSAWDKIQAGIQGFYDERSEFLQAAQERVAPGPGVLQRVLNRAKRSERSETEGAPPSTNRLDSRDG